MIKKIYQKNIISSYLQILIAILLPLLLTPVLIKTLGQDEFGLWILLTSITMYFNLSSFGFTTTLLKNASSNINDTKSLSKDVSVVFFTFIAFSFISFFIFLGIYYNINTLFKIDDLLLEKAKMTFIIIYCIFIVNFFTSIFSTILFASGKLYINNILIILKSLLIAVGTFIIVYNKFSIFEISLWTMLISTLFFIVTYINANKSSVYVIKYNLFDYTDFKKMLFPSVHYFIISIAVVIIFYSDNIIISSFIGLSAVAVYSVAYKLLEAVQKVIFKIVDIILPDIAVLYTTKQYNTLLKLHNKMLMLSILISLPIYIFLFFYGEEILTLWVGKENVIQKDILIIFIIFSFVHTWVHVSAVFITAMGIHKETSYMALLEAILNILFSIYLLKQYGLLGVALGTLIAHLLTNGWFVNWWFYYKMKKKLKDI